MKEFIKEHLHDDINELALQAQKYRNVDMRKALLQIRGWQIAEKKLPLWVNIDGVIFPGHLPLEQCSSQQTAEYKCSIINDIPCKNRMTDLTGGFGVDSTIIGRIFSHLTFVERDIELCRLAENNLPLLGVKYFLIKNQSSEEAIANLPHQDLIYIDPTRRDSNGNKTVAITDCIPDVCALNKVLIEKADKVMVKLSPMLDLASVEKELEGVEQIHIVSLNGECKEILVILSNKTVNSPVIITCANITDKGIQRFVFTHEEERLAECHYASELNGYLYEPNASIMKGCCFKLLAQKYGIEKLHPNSHLYTSSHFLEDFPGRIFGIEKTLSMSKQDMKELKTIGKANLTIRNFPLRVAELRKKLKLSDGGSAYLFATTIADGKKIIIKTNKI